MAESERAITVSASAEHETQTEKLAKAWMPLWQGSGLVVVGFSLLSEQRGPHWLWVLGLALSQLLVNFGLAWGWRQARRPAWVRLVSALFNLGVSGGIVGLTGAATPPVWIIFIAQAIDLALGFKRPGVYLTAAVLFLAQTARGVMGGWTWDGLIDTSLQSLAVLGVGLVTHSFHTLWGREQQYRQQAEQLGQAAAARLAGLLTSVAAAIIAVDQAGRVALFNESAERIFGYTAAEILGQPFNHLVSAEFTQLHEYIHALITQPQLTEVGDVSWDVTGRQRSGHIFPAEVLLSKFQDGPRLLVILTLHDVTEREQTAVALQESNETLTQWVTEREQIAFKLQEANTKLTRWVNELEQRNRDSGLLNAMGDLLQACRNADEAATVITQTAQYLFPNQQGLIGLLDSSGETVEPLIAWGEYAEQQDNPPFTFNSCVALQRQKLHLVSSNRPTDPTGPTCQHVHPPPPQGYLCVPLLAQGEVLGVLHLRLCSNESNQIDYLQQFASMAAEHMSLAISNLRLRESLRQQSIRDPLTGLYNRRHMQESFERELQRALRQQQALSVVMLDIDHFKRFNDTFGHAAGDALLRELGKFLQAHIRSSDIACRYGGEEFTLIFPQASQEDTRRRAEQIRQEVGHIHIQHEDQVLGDLTLSLGVATLPQHGITAEALLQAADAALYQAKHAGRNRVVVAE